MDKNNNVKKMSSYQWEGADNILKNLGIMLNFSHIDTLMDVREKC